MELITTLDDVDLGLRGMSAQDLASPAGAGLLAMQGRLLQAIAKLGAEYYPALGETFDPHRHKAMGSVSDPTLPENHVVDELRRGYLYRGRIVRYSLVRVANPR